MEDNKLMHEDYELDLTSNEPVRELFTSKNVRFKTEVTEEQRAALAILYHAYNEAIKRGINFSALKDVLDGFVDFGVSLDRKSRNEFVDTFKGFAINPNKDQADPGSQDQLGKVGV